MRNVSPSRTDSPPWITWLHRTLGVMLEATPKQTVCNVGGVCSAPALIRRPKGFEHLDYVPRPHKHVGIELALTLEGSAILEIEETYFAMKHPGVAIIGPNVEHCEGRWRKSQSYRLLWIIPRLSGECGLNISCYHPSSGWDPAQCVHFSSKAAPRLIQRITGAESPGKFAGQFELIRSDALAILVEALTYVAESAAATSRAVASSPWRPLIAQVKAYLQTNFHGAISVESLSRMYQVNTDYLNRRFRQATGKSIHAYLIGLRMEMAAALCRESAMLIKQIALSVGYRDPLHFSRMFHQFFGRSPEAFRRASRRGR